MNTPICDFVAKYANSKALRLHMPGHKGKNFLGFEELDLTEIDGADSLYEASGIIAESEENASALFGSKTLYSTEGSSLSIRAMLFLSTLYAKEHNLQNTVLAGRNAHKAFLSAAALLDTEIDWLPSEDKESYLCFNITAEKLDSVLSSYDKKPMAVYITSPDYLGNISDIRGISQICRKHKVLLLVDNAHGAYLKFLPESVHPMDLGADMCCDSAHKTLPVLTPGAYLHINPNSDIPVREAKNALALFGTTSPSYLILQSLDFANKYVSDSYKTALAEFLPLVRNLKDALIKGGYTLVGNEELKVTIRTKPYGYSGKDMADILKEKNIYCEFADPDFIVFMLTPETTKESIKTLQDILLSIPAKSPIDTLPPVAKAPVKAMSVRQALLSERETLPISECEGRILSVPCIGCPPAVCVIVSGEVIDQNTLEFFRYYSIDNCTVVK